MWNKTKQTEKEKQKKNGKKWRNEMKENDFVDTETERAWYYVFLNHLACVWTDFVLNSSVADVAEMGSGWILRE